MPESRRTRLTPQARRAQLIELGVQMLSERSLDELSVEDLAEQAGISRGLLFHYFRSKQEFHLEVVRNMAHELVTRTEPDPRLDPDAQLRDSLAAFVDYITENPKAYVSLVRGAASGDAVMRAVFDETRAQLALRVIGNLKLLDLPSGPTAAIAVHGWVAFTEEVVIRWLSGDAEITRDEVLEVLANSLTALVLSSHAGLLIRPM